MKSIGEIREELKQVKEDEVALFLAEYENDERESVQKILASARKRQEKWEAELARLALMRSFENEHPEAEFICGIDEAGRGPLAGPVVAGAVILPKDKVIPYVNDSKKLSEKKREELYDIIREEALSVGVGIMSETVIDDINILQATYEAMRQAIASLDPQPQLLLNDAVTIPKLSIPQVPIIKGDAKSISIASASIIAKVTRDRIMLEYDRMYPEYGFAGHKGYGSAAHIAAIKEFGPCPIHRRSFIKNFV